MANQYVLSYAAIDTVTNGPREVVICIDKANEDLIVHYSMPEDFGETPADDPVVDDPAVDDNSNTPEPSPSGDATASSGGGGLTLTWLMLFMFASCVRRVNKFNGL